MPAKYGPKAHEAVHKELHHRKTKKHGSMTRKQAIAIGLSKARRGGAKVPRRPAARRKR